MRRLFRIHRSLLDIKQNLKLFTRRIHSTDAKLLWQMVSIVYNHCRAASGVQRSVAIRTDRFNFINAKRLTLTRICALRDYFTRNWLTYKTSGAVRADWYEKNNKSRSKTLFLGLWRSPHGVDWVTVWIGWFGRREHSWGHCKIWSHIRLHVGCHALVTLASANLLQYGVVHKGRP